MSCWKASSLAMKPAHSPAPTGRSWASSSRPTAAPFFLMKSARCIQRSRPSYCPCSRTTSSPPLGGKRDIQVDVRVLAATNKPLERAVEEGVFREDLFYRLNVVTIHIPPLRERREEIPVFLKYFLEKYSEHYGKKPAMFSEYAVARMMEYAWPGNIRELENLVKRYVIVGNEAQIIRELSTHKPIVTSVDASAPAQARINP